MKKKDKELEMEFNKLSDYDKTYVILKLNEIYYGIIQDIFKEENKTK